MRGFIFAALVCGLSYGAAAADAPLFSSSPKVLVRSPEPAKLAKFYEALGFKMNRVSENGSVIFYFEGGAGALEVVQMDANTKPGPRKTSRTQQGVLAILETDNQDEVVRRAKAAGATLIEKWDASDRPVSIYYIADPENNVLGFAPRHHDPRLKTP
jgi:catechol 2,3-dioxygenase-like lactoylglutathione lyase family enzyme